jgi:hypothetical protein
MPRQVDYYFSLHSWSSVRNPRRSGRPTSKIARMRSLPMFGSPGYVLGREVFWGQDRIELLADALKSGRAPYRSQV